MNLKKLALAVAVSGFFIGGIVPEAEASRSYYDRVASMTNTESQKRSVERYIYLYTKMYEAYNKAAQRLVGILGADHSVTQKYITKADFYFTELEKYTALKDQISGPAPVSLVSEKSSFTEVAETEVQPSKEVNSESKIITETLGTLVKEFAEITKTFEIVTLIHTYRVKTTTKVYSDGSTKPGETSRELLDTVSSTETRTVTDRELLREYQLEVVEEDTESESNATVVTGILTYDEYVARDDVDLSLTDTYRKAVSNMNSRINPDYADRISESYGKTLEAVGAPVAWSRGYTGKGSTIAILDSGIDLDHSEFQGRILDTGCFTTMCENGYETIDDGNRKSHGTHVAGIAGASLDGEGVTGVAPDADLLIAKVAYDSGFYQFGAAAKAINWATSKGAVVVNMSGNTNVSRAYGNAMVETSEAGVYRLDDEWLLSVGYGTHGYNRTMESQSTKDLMAAISGSNVVAVVSAGNQRMPFATFPGHLAIEENDDGTLKLGGRMMVVGNWDLRTQKLSSSSNKAGTICLQYDEDKDTCGGSYRVKDFYILAPGTHVASTDNNGEYVTSSGTSMAAPVVSGAVAVVHQMWPHMTGANLAKLLLNTADKTIKGYDENIHGQGLLDLDEATKPQGALGIPTTGRITDNTVAEISGQVSMSGGTISGLEEVMAVDAYDRDYYFNANDLVQAADTRTISYTVAHKDLLNTNAYAGFAYTQNLAGEQSLIGLSEDGSELSLAYDFENGMTIGLVMEDDSFLGNMAESAIMRVDGATTAYVGYNSEFNYSDITVFGGANFGATTLDIGDSTMLKSADTLLSNTANIGAKYNMSNSEIGVVASLPVAITSGGAEFQVADSVSAAGDINYKTVNSSLASGAREYNIGAFYNLNVTDEAHVSMYAEHRINYAGQADVDTVEAGIKFKVKF